MHNYMFIHINENIYTYESHLNRYVWSSTFYALLVSGSLSQTILYYWINAMCILMIPGSRFYTQKVYIDFLVDIAEFKVKGWVTAAIVFFMVSVEFNSYFPCVNLHFLFHYVKASIKSDSKSGSFSVASHDLF